MNSIEDNSYNEMKGRSAIQWLTETMNSENKIDKSGAKVTLEHIEYLNRRIRDLEGKNALKDEYLKKLKMKNA